MRGVVREPMWRRDEGPVYSFEAAPARRRHWSRAPGHPTHVEAHCRNPADRSRRRHSVCPAHAWALNHRNDRNIHSRIGRGAPVDPGARGCPPNGCAALTACRLCRGGAMLCFCGCAALRAFGAGPSSQARAAHSHSERDPGATRQSPDQKVTRRALLFLLSKRAGHAMSANISGT